MSARFFRILVIVLAGLLATGALLRPVENAAHNLSAAPGQKKLELKNHAKLGGGIVLGVVGGFRGIAADVFWLRSYGHWRDFDAVRTSVAIEWALTLTPERKTFWLNAARMIAYDFSQWEIEKRRANERALPAAVEQKIREAHAQRALAFLERGRLALPDAPEIPLEMAAIHGNVRGDFSAAAASYREAALLPSAPFFAARLHAEMLKRLGRYCEARDWLKSVLEKLPADNPLAQREVVAQRIRELDAQCK